MTQQTVTQKNQSLSWRWKLLAAAALVLALVALVEGGFWASAAVLFVSFLILAYGKPFRRYRKFVYRAVFPAGAIILVLNWYLDTSGLIELISEPVRRLFVAFAISVPIGILPVLIMREIYVGLKIGWVSASIPDVSRRDAAALLRSLYFGLNYPVMVVDGAQAKTTLESGPSGPGGLLQKLGGPGLVFVNHGYAVVLEWAGKFRRVARAGATTLDLWERPKAVVDLRPHRRVLQLEDIYTKDGIMLGMGFSIIYQIRPAVVHSEQPVSLPTPQPPRRPNRGATGSSVPAAPRFRGVDALGQDDLIDLASKPLPSSPDKRDRYPVSDADLLKATYAVDNWEEATEALAGYVLRDLMAQYEVERIFSVDPGTKELLVQARRLCDEALERVNCVSETDWGVRCLRVDIGSAKVPSEVRRQLLRTWMVSQNKKTQMLQAEVDATVMQTKGAAEVAILRSVESVKAEVRTELIRQFREAIGVSTDLMPQDTAQRLFDVVDSLTRELVTEDVTRLREVEMMERVAGGDGNKTFVFGSSNGLLLSSGKDDQTGNGHR